MLHLLEVSLLALAEATRGPAGHRDEDGEMFPREALVNQDRNCLPT